MKDFCLAEDLSLSSCDDFALVRGILARKSYYKVAFNKKKYFKKCYITCLQ